MLAFVTIDCQALNLSLTDRLYIGPASECDPGVSLPRLSFYLITKIQKDKAGTTGVGDDGFWV